jgi:hypothetical protein
MASRVASTGLRDKLGDGHFAVAKAGWRVIAQIMALYGPRDLDVACVAIGGRIDGDPSSRGSAPSVQRSGSMPVDGGKIGRLCRPNRSVA